MCIRDSSNCSSSECRELVEAIQKFGAFDDKNIVQTTLMEKLEKISTESYEEFCYRQDEKLFTVTPKDEEFIEPMFRLLSETIVSKNWNPTSVQFL